VGCIFNSARLIISLVKCPVYIYSYLFNYIECTEKYTFFYIQILKLIFLTCRYFLQCLDILQESEKCFYCHDIPRINLFHIFVGRVSRYKLEKQRSMWFSQYVSVLNNLMQKIFQYLKGHTI
jgi:hypothetical protein